MISFWHDIDVVDVLDVCGIDNDKSMSSMKEFPQIIRDLLLWRAYCTDKQNATDVTGNIDFICCKDLVRF